MAMGQSYLYMVEYVRKFVLEILGSLGIVLATSVELY